MLGISKINVIKVTQQFVQITQGRGRFNNSQGFFAAWNNIAAQPISVIDTGPQAAFPITEGDCAIVVGQQIRLTTLKGRAQINTNNVSMSILLRVNFVTIATLIIPAGNTALQTVTVNTVLAAGDRINYLYDVPLGAGFMDDVSCELEYDGSLV